MMSNASQSDQLGQINTANPLVIVVSGPSGVGKDAILNRMKQKGYPFIFITTLTTRPRRNSEKHQVDYHFISVEEFQELLKSDGLLEWANVYGNWYGVPKEPVKEALGRGLDTIIKVDVQGAANIKKILPNAIFIFILPPSMSELSNRLTQRCTETAADLSVRLKTAEVEMQQINHFDYSVMNPCNDIDSAIQDILAIVKAEKCRVNPRRIKL
jgi:guanylate kinase